MYFCVRERYAGCCSVAAGEARESDRQLISVPMSSPATSAGPAMGSHTGRMGAAGLIAAGQHGEMFL